MARTAPVPNIPPIPGMCPSIAVMGGGGGGGGSGGDGAGNGDGSGAEGGNGNGDGAGGDGSGAGSCGNGSGGSCSNCSSGAAAGDPVDCLTGEVFTLPKTDLFLPGPFNLKLDRKYSSFSRKHDVGLGWGWSHTLSWRGEVKRDRIVIHTGTGQVIDFPLLEVGQAAAIKGWGLLRIAQGYALRPGDEFLHFFSADLETPETLLLRSITYRNLGSLQLFYDRGRLVRVVDAAGRTIQFHHGSDGRISSITVPDPAGAGVITFARYRYDGEGHLVEAVDADGHAWLYEYDDNHRLIRLYTPQGPVFHFLYDREGRCVETWGARPDGTREPALAPEVPDVLADGSPAKGIYHVRLDFGGDGYSEVVDSVRVQRYFTGSDGKAAKSINGRGGVTSRRIDDQGNIVAHTDANSATWQYRYDGLGHVLESTDPEGRKVRFDRDPEGRLTRVIDARGGIIEYGINADGHTEWAKNQSGALHRMSYDQRGLLRSEMRADGGVIRYERDAHGNIVSMTLPNGAAYKFQFDFWGRRVAEWLPDGRSYRFTYSPAGFLVEAVDGTGQFKRYERDSLGNLVSETMPDGNQIRFERSGLGWLWAIRQPDGTQILRQYNREGWVLRVLNEANERYELGYNASGAIVMERAFDGVECKYVRDARDYVIEIIVPNGKTVIERNKVGQIVKFVANDGEEKVLEYDAGGDLAGATTKSARFSWQRDAVGDVIRETVSIAGTPYSIETKRDILGRRIGMTTSLGHTVESQRDLVGDVTAVWADGAEVERFSRDATGWLVRRDLPAGGAIADEVDGAGRLQRRHVEDATAIEGPTSGQPDWVGGPTGGDVDKRFQYTALSEVASITTTAGGTTEYTYDLRRHLLARRDRSGAELYYFDSRGNPYEAGTDAMGRLYSEGSNLATRGDTDYAHDSRSRLVEKRVRLPNGRQEATRFSYDAWDLLRAVDLPAGGRIEFGYDAFARRVLKRTLERAPNGKHREVSSIHYVWDLLSIVHQVERRRGSPAVLRTYLYEDNNELVPLAQKSASDGWLHYVHAVNGTPEELVDDRGKLASRASQTAYGRTIWSSESTPFRFPGQLDDPETGLHYNRYRTYDPTTGRYLTRDPLREQGELNAFEYGPNPVGWIDPMGLQHFMGVQGPTGFHDGGNRPMSDRGDGRQYESGFQGLPDGHELRSQARCHTEQRFARDLINSGQQGGNYQLNGCLPPCPNCHRALQHASDRSGASITYNWHHPEHGPQSMTYTPNAPPHPTGGSATTLAGAYAMTGDASRRNEYRYNNWGGANQAYRDASAGIPM